MSDEKKRQRVSYEVTKRYQDKALKIERIVLHREHDKDIIEELEKQDNKSGYIKESIRERMRREHPEN